MIFFNEIMSMSKRDGFIPYEYCGHTYYIDPERQNYYDKVLKGAEDHGVVVAGILLINQNWFDRLYASTMCHPEHNGGNYTMPDVTDFEGVHAYAATLEYLANRYSIPGNGRIHHWIMHNEVDQQLIWTNMGDQPMIRFTDQYEKSMRMASNIVRQYDPNAYILASFTSSWNMTNGDGGYPVKQMLDLMVNYSNVEGDYRWGVAAHPYPISFHKPNFWEADTDATYDENSGYSTFKNIEVISDWMLRREHYYKNQEKRILFFSENGVNALDNSIANQRIQAAGAAWAWKKAKVNSGVDAIMWYNWNDNPAEGFALGLRDQNLNKKLSWYVWQAAGTDNESKVLDPYLSTIGITDWNSIHQNVSVVGSESINIKLDPAVSSDMACTYDYNSQIYTITANGADPHINSIPFDQNLSAYSNVLTFEYCSDKDLNLQVFLCDNGVPYEFRSITSPLKATSDDEWKRVFINLSAMRSLMGDWGKSGTILRFDTGSGWSTANVCNFRIRHISINSGEVEPMGRLYTLMDWLPIQCTVNIDEGRGETTVTTTGTDPGFFSTRLPANLLPSADKVTFEYQSSADINDFTLYFCDTPTEYRSVKATPMKATTAWTPFTIDISPVLKNSGWGFEGDYLRIDPGSKSGVTFKIRSLRVCDGKLTEEQALTIDSRRANDLSLTRYHNPEAAEAERIPEPELQYDSWAINTTGADPYVLTNPLKTSLSQEASKLHIFTSPM